MTETENEKRDRENELIDDVDLTAPDGGWGYVVAIALTLNFICLYGHMTSFGMLYNDFLVERNEGSSGVTIIMSICFTVMSVSGILANVAVKTFTLRQVAVFGAVCYTLGWLLNFFVEAVYQMAFTTGILQGFGLGAVTTLTFASFNTYFVQKRMMVLSICQVIVGVASMLYPLFLEQLLKEYGFRGSILILGALMGHTIIGTACFQPVEWYKKRKPLYHTVPADESVIRIHEGVKISEKAKIEEMVEETEDKSSKWKTIIEYMDLTLLQDVIYVNITLGIALALASDVGFFLLFPLYLYSLDFSTSQVATCIFLVSAADLVSRGILAVGRFKKITSRSVFFISVVGSLITKILFLQCSSYLVFVVLACAMGLWRGPMQLSVPLIYAEFSPEKFTAAYGLSILFMGNGNSLILPCAGYLRDITQSYMVAFYTLTFFPLVCILPWCYEYWYFSKNKKSQQEIKT